MKGGDKAPAPLSLPIGLEQHPNSTNMPVQELWDSWPYHHRPLRAQHRCSAWVVLPGMARAPATGGAHWSWTPHPLTLLHLGLGIKEAGLCLGTREDRAQRGRCA